MHSRHLVFSSAAAAVLVLSAHAAAADVQIGASGKTFASAGVACAADPATGLPTPMVEAGLYRPKRGATATVSLDDVALAAVTTRSPSTTVWLDPGNHMVKVAISRKTVDRFTFAVPEGLCNLPDTSGNTFSADGTLEYAASGKSYTTVTPGCAMNPAAGRAQPYVRLFDNGGFLLNVSVNGVPLTQLSAMRPSTPVFLSSGTNVLSADNAGLSIDDFIRDGGNGTCTLP